MGEMHYSRFSQERWNQNLAEMKSLGVDIVSTCYEVTVVKG